MSQDADYYAELGVTRKATIEEIRHAYHLAARQAHPDARVSGVKTERFLKIQRAYEVLSSPSQRAAYDKTLPPVETITPPLEDFSTIFSRSTLQIINEHQLIYALLELSPPPEAKNRPRPPLNISLVIDCSTSMQGERMDTVKRTALELTNQLQPEDILSVVSFSDRATVHISAERHLEHHHIHSQIQKIQAGGGTEIYQGLEAGFLEIRKRSPRGYIKHIILLTDGQTYGDEEACLQLADQAAAHGVGISCLGIGHEWNDTLLDSLALRTGGSIMFVSQPVEIRHFLKRKISGLHQVYAEHVTLEIDPNPGVELQYAFRRFPDAAPLPISSPIQLGNIPSNSDLVLVLEFKIAPISQETSSLQLLSGRFNLEYPHQPGDTSTIPIEISLPVSDTLDQQPPPTKVLQSVSHLTLYRMQARAQKYLSEGNSGQASQYLNNLATQLFAHGEHELARTVLEEADNVEHEQGLSEAGKKQIKYGTRALLLPGQTPKRDSNDRGEERL